MKDKCCLEMENLVTIYKLSKDYFSEMLCIIILYLQAFQSGEVEWRKLYGTHI